MERINSKESIWFGMLLHHIAARAMMRNETQLELDNHAYILERVIKGECLYPLSWLSGLSMPPFYSSTSYIREACTLVLKGIQEGTITYTPHARAADRKVK